jgi:hypothetical protein
MKHTLFCLALALASCSKTTTPATPSPRETAALAAANSAADALGRTLRERLMAAMAEGGVQRAAEVCAGEAGQLTRQVAARHGTAEAPALVGRASLRMRGGDAPPAWVRTWLEATGERPASEAVGLARVEEGRARVLRPIAVEAPCLLCHGDSLEPAVEALLRARYPNDRATGYRVGDLRGALYADLALPE